MFDFDERSMIITDVAAWIEFTVQIQFSVGEHFVKCVVPENYWMRLDFDKGLPVLRLDANFYTLQSTIRVNQVFRFTWYQEVQLGASTSYLWENFSIVRTFVTE